MSQLQNNSGLKDEVLKQIQNSETPQKAKRSYFGLFIRIAAVVLIGIFICVAVISFKSGPQHEEIATLDDKKTTKSKDDVESKIKSLQPSRDALDWAQADERDTEKWAREEEQEAKKTEESERKRYETQSRMAERESSAAIAPQESYRINESVKTMSSAAPSVTGASGPGGGGADASYFIPYREKLTAKQVSPSPAPVTNSAKMWFQIASSDDLDSKWTYSGPSGTASSYYTTNGKDQMPSINKRYLRYKVFLSKDGSATSPKLDDVTITYINIEVDPEQVKVAPIPGTNLPNGAKFFDMFFESEGVNPFVDTDEQSTSTFAVDVDTASYTVTRNYLKRGALPPKEAIRVEEFINYFKHDYKAPADRDFAAYLDGCPSQFGDGYQLLRVGLKGREVLLKDRKPAALTFIIDVSGSMNMENRLGLVKEALTLLVNQMNEKDSVGIVVYGTNARVLLAPKRVTDKNAILNAINSLAPEGSTNAEEGLMFGYRQASSSRMENGINRVILCSDGVANNGVTDADKLVKQVADYTAQGIFLSVIGFGMGNYNDVLMEKLADKGNGNYAYVDDIKEAKRIFTQNLSGTLQVIAKDVKIQVEFNPKTVKKYRLLGYENRHIENKDFRNDKVDAGEIGAGHEVTALYEIKLYDTDEAKKEEKIATVRLRHKKPAEEKATEFEQAFTREIFTKTFEKAPLSLRLDAAVAEYAEILRHSYWARGSSLQNVITLVKKLNEEFDEREDVKELVDLVQKASELQQAEKPNQ